MHQLPVMATLATLRSSLRLGAPVPTLVIAHGHDPNSAFSCETADNVNVVVNLLEGVYIDLQSVCPEKCGVPCGHAPTGDVDAQTALSRCSLGTCMPTAQLSATGGFANIRGCRS